MRKKITMVVLGGGLALTLAGCAQQGRSEGQTSTLPTGAQPASQTANEQIGAPASDGNAQQAMASAPVPTSMGATSSKGGHYQMTRESSNYLVAQNKTSVGSPQAGYFGDDGSVRTGTATTAEEKPSTLYQQAMVAPLSTFSADVDTASYANLRRSLTSGATPDPASVRVEEMLNYFTYNLPEPRKGEPFSVTSELSDCPWNKDAQLLRLAIKTKAIEESQRPPINLVFLLDVSGSMSSPEKLPLLQSSLKTLVDNLDDADRIAIVTYAGDSGLVLPSTPASEKTRILKAIDNLQSGGSTNGASGIELAYQVAKMSGSEDSVNRVVLCTDGDFNVGPSSPEALKTLIEEKRKSGLFLSVLGFGETGNDKLMETLADNGNGNYASIDSPLEARKVLVEEAGATLVTVAKDVKFQIAFNPLLVEKYRVLGYENRMLATRDFDDDKKDAGDLGAGHSVTVLYEILPPKSKVASVGAAFAKVTGAKPTEQQLAMLKLRYKEPTEDESQLIEVPVSAFAATLLDASPDQRWAVAVTGFGLRLHGDASGKTSSLDQIAALAQGAGGQDGDSYRREFLKLVNAARKLPS